MQEQTHVLEVVPATGTHDSTPIQIPGQPMKVNPDPLFSDPRFGYRHVRYNSSPAEQNLANKKANDWWSHAAPYSVLVCAIGNHWKANSWQRVLDMVHYSNQMGFKVTLDEIMDRCQNPYDALGAMRNEAVMRGMEGYDYLMMVDTDVFPEKDLLVRLIAHELPIVAPYVYEPTSRKPLHGPFRYMGKGLQPVKWCVLSCLLFDIRVFNATGPTPWNNAIGADEGYHFQEFYHYGFRPRIDTNLVLQVGRDPTYPLATNRMAEKDATAFWDNRREMLAEMPDRRPINGADTRINEHGEYLPFLPVKPIGVVAGVAPALPMAMSLEALRALHT